MGFFNRIFKKRKTKNDSAKSQEISRTKPREMPRELLSSSYREQCKQIEQELPDNIREILQTEFSQYELKENLPVTDIDPDQDFGGPIDFALQENERVVLAIMIIERDSKKYTKRVHGVELACQKTGAGFANFRKDFNNPHFPWSREHALAYLKKNIKQ